MGKKECHAREKGEGAEVVKKDALVVIIVITVVVRHSG